MTIFVRALATSNNQSENDFGLELKKLWIDYFLAYPDVAHLLRRSAAEVQLMDWEAKKSAL